MQCRYLKLLKNRKQGRRAQGAPDGGWGPLSLLHANPTYGTCLKYVEKEELFFNEITCVIMLARQTAENERLKLTSQTGRLSTMDQHHTTDYDVGFQYRKEHSRRETTAQGYYRG